MKNRSLRDASLYGVGILLGIVIGTAISGLIKRPGTITYQKPIGSRWEAEEIDGGLRLTYKGNCFSCPSQPEGVKAEKEASP